MTKYIFFLLLCWCGLLKAQTVIRGHVRSADSGKPLSGATVSAGAVNKASTDSTGYFIIAVPNNTKRITTSFTGFETATTNLPSSRSGAMIDITLKSRVNQMKEVTVSTGYQTLPLERATGSFAQVNNQLFDRKVSADVLSRLEGVVPGLLFNRNTFNASNGIADISIRGTSTIYGQSQPLVVVDGFPYDGDINNINPNTVESVTVLKDAAAASIWGIKSGNGVIVLTTKRGLRNKKLTVDFNANVTIGDKPNLTYNPHFLNANDFINLEQALYSKGYYDSDISSGNAPISPVVALLAAQTAGKLTATQATARIDALRHNDVRNDLSKYFYRKSLAQQYALNLSGGNTNSNYYFSTGYDKSLASQAGNQSDRITINSLYNFYPVNNLVITAGINYTQNHTTSNSPLANINGGANKPGLYPYARLADDHGNSLAIVKDYAAGFTDTAGAGKLYDWKYRPLDELQYADNTSTGVDNRMNFGIRYNFIGGLSAEAKYLYENQKSTGSNYFSDQTYYARDLINQFTQISGSDLNYPVPQGGILQAFNSDLTSHRGRFQVNYMKAWNAKSDLSMIAGAEINQTIVSSDANTAYGFSKENETYQNVDFVSSFLLNPSLNYAQIPTTLGFGKTTDRYLSYFSNVGYTYDSRYTVSASARIDRSNLFGVKTNQKAVPLYSLGFSWELSKEAFYKIDWLPYSKLRITYGYNGNIDKNVTAVTTALQLSGANFTGYPFSVITNPGNPRLRWEKDRMINLGYDFAFKGQVVSGSLEYYAKRGEDLFGDSPLPPSTGVSKFRGNTAGIKGTGVDVVINANLINHNRFRWQANFLGSYALDKVTKYDVNLTALSYIILGNGNAGTIYPLVNQPLYAIYSFKSAGLTHDTGDPQGYLNGAPSTDYATILAGTTTKNLNYNGPSRPTTFGSLRNTFSYGQFSMSFNILYKLNYYFRRSSIAYSALFNGWDANKDYVNRWQKPGDEAITNVPSLPYPPLDGNRETFYTYSSALVDKGDHIRLQDISLNFELLGKSANQRLPFSQLKIYGFVNNVGILWKANHDGIDPDLYSGSSYPTPRTFAVGIKATLK